MTSLLATGTGTALGASKRASTAGFTLEPEASSPSRALAKTKKPKKSKSKKTLPVAVTSAPENVSAQGPPPIHFAAPGGFDVGDATGLFTAARGAEDLEDDDGMPIVEKQVREVCFNCWSRGMGAKCEMHLPPGERDRPVPPGQSVLVCTNWDIASIARKFRSEEIQEVCIK